MTGGDGAFRRVADRLAVLGRSRDAVRRKRELVDLEGMFVSISTGATLQRARTGGYPPDWDRARIALRGNRRA
jgi:hypothetical protein